MELRRNPLGPFERSPDGPTWVVLGVVPTWGQWAAVNPYWPLSPTYWSTISTTISSLLARSSGTYMPYSTVGSA